MESKAIRVSDCDLMIAMARGDNEALRMLTSRYSRLLTAFAWRIIGDQLDAQEVAADVLWQAWCESGAFVPQRGAVLTWLMTLTRNRAIDRLRANRVRERPYELSLNGVPDPSAEVDLTERARIVHEAMAGLRCDERMVLQLAYFADLSHQQIADELDIPLGTVKTRIRMAMIKLYQLLTPLRD
jgi:RNA polymerase sigma-70 factor (ECF subfamily)